MIDINLIPAALRKDGQGNAHSLAINIPKEVLLGVGSGLILLMVAAHLVLGALWLAGSGRLSSDNVNWQKILPIKTEYDAMNKESWKFEKEDQDVF